MRIAINCEQKKIKLKTSARGEEDENVIKIVEMITLFII